MTTYWFYLFADPRYELGVKFGFCSYKLAKRAWKAAPSCTPEGMLYLASWPVTLPFTTADGTLFEAGKGKVNRLETHVLDRLGPRMNRMPGHCRAGREWVYVSAPDAIATVSSILKSGPAVTDFHVGREIPTNDNFRTPHPRNLRNLASRSDGKAPVKIAVWVYEEALTGRLKTQYAHDWSMPFEKARRYSRNGISERSAFGYPGPACPDGNERVYGAWKEAMRVFGPGPDDRKHGWLNEGVQFAAVEDFYRQLGLAQFPAVKHEIPEGIWPAYNRSPIDL